MNSSRDSRVRAVVVNYNSGALLEECVRRLAASPSPPEIVVVDNASTDGSLERVRAMGLAGLRIVNNPANLGFAMANNIALRDWDGDYALLLNPDCLVEADTLEGMLKVMEQMPAAGMAGCVVRNPDGSEQAGCRRMAPTPARIFGSLFGKSRINLAHEPLPEEAVPVEAISGAFMLVRMAAVHDVGLLDEGYFMHWEDLDWCMRFRRAGWDVLFVPGISVTHVKGACSTALPVRMEWHKHRGMVRYYEKFFRARYPSILLWLIYAAVWARFGLKAAASLLRGRPLKT